MYITQSESDSNIDSKGTKVSSKDNINIYSLHDVYIQAPYNTSSVYFVHIVNTRIQSIHIICQSKDIIEAKLCRLQMLGDVVCFSHESELVISVFVPYAESFCDPIGRTACF